MGTLLYVLDGLGRWGWARALATIPQGCLLAALAYGLMKVLRLRSGVLRYRIWVAVFAGIVLLPLLSTVSVSLSLPLLHLSVLPVESGVALGAPAREVASDASRKPASAPVVSGPWRPESGGHGESAGNLNAGGAGGGVYSITRYAAGAAAWLAVALVLLTRLWMALRATFTAARDGAEVGCNETLGLFRRIAAEVGLRDPPRLITSIRIDLPVAFGLARGWVMLPEEFAEDTSAGDLEWVLLHEAAHLRRRDALVALVVAMFRSVLFLNPVLWLIERQVRFECESACDEWVLARWEDGRSYAKMLGRLAVRHGCERPRPLFAADLYPSRSQAERRIKMILDRLAWPRQGRRSAAGAATLALVVLMTGVLAATDVGAANAGGPPHPEVKAEAGIEIRAMVVEVPSSEMDKVKTVLGTKQQGFSIGKKPEGGEAVSSGLTVAIPQTDNLEALIKMLATGELKGKILWTPTVLTDDGKEATVKTTKGKIHYLERVKDNLYELKEMEDPGSSLRVTPTVKGDGVEVAIELHLTDIGGRAALPDAPDLEAGMPMMGMRQVSSTIAMPNGRTVVLGGLRGKASETLVLLTVKTVNK